MCVYVNMSECLVYIFGICNRAQFCTKIQKNIVSLVQLKSKNDEEVLRAYTKCMCVFCASVPFYLTFYGNAECDASLFILSGAYDDSCLGIFHCNHSKACVRQRKTLEKTENNHRHLILS